jgi:hypothetical protein
MMLFLDDERVPHEVTWITLYEGSYDIVRTQEEFQAWILTHGIPNVISFDNDLGANMGEGIHCVNWLIDQVLDTRVAWNPDFQYTIHSKNVVAADLMRSKLDQFSKFMNSG